MKATKEFRLEWTQRAEDIVKKLTLEDKVGLMSGTMTFQQEMDNTEVDPDNLHYNHIPYTAGGNEQYNIIPMLFCDGPRGVVCGNGKSTCFPVTMLRGASFDAPLEEKIGEAIAKEIKAFGGNLFGGVCINLPYNPGWGRSQETYGEESFHLGAMGSALVQGIQSEDVIACIKHFAFNQMENARFDVSVECDKRTEREVYLPHFRECIEAGAAAVMSSYNKFRGTYCGHNDYLLNKVLKDEWDFDGLVMSDFYWGVKDTVEAANGGQNIEMAHTKFFGDKLIDAVKSGKVPEYKIDDAALRIIRTLLAFDSSKKNVAADILACDDHVSLALESARKGITLLQNNHNILPFNKNNMKKLLIVGSLAGKELLGDHGSSWVRPPYTITPIQGVKQVAPDIEIIHETGENIKNVQKLAKEVDAVIFVTGYDHDDEGEYVPFDDAEGFSGSIGGDRKDSLGLHSDDIELIKKVGKINENSVVVLIGGNTIMMTEWHKEVKAVLMAYYPGMEGGRALAEIIFGDINPSGKLPYVLPIHETDLPIVDWNAKSQYYDYYHGYTKLEKEGKTPLKPYGYGLSYTTFSINDVVFKQVARDIHATFRIKNTGNRSGTEVVQFYVGYNNSSINRPVKTLRGFKRIELQAGEEKSITIICPIKKLRYYNEETDQMALESMLYEMYIGTSSDNRDLLKGTLELKI